jgi:hypothetical protein
MSRVRSIIENYDPSAMVARRESFLLRKPENPPFKSLHVNKVLKVV